MRVHVVTPKAPVSVTVNPRVQPDLAQPVYFYPTTKGLIQLTWAKYYVLRLPYAYQSPQAVFYPPKTRTTAGRLLKGMLSVIESEV